MKTVTITLAVEVEDKKHPIPNLSKLIEFRVCSIPGVIDCNEVSPWIPIETAPKDKALLLYCGSHYEIGHFNTLLGGWVENWNHRPIKPTNWMPLPAAPGAASLPAPKISHGDGGYSIVLPEPYQRAVYATAKNTSAVRKGYEMGGYVKTPDLWTEAQIKAILLAEMIAANAASCNEVKSDMISLRVVELPNEMKS